MTLPPKVEPVRVHSRQFWRVGDTWLTRREMEVLRLVTAGLHNKEVAARLCMSIKTVEKHRQRCNEKLKVDCAIAMARAALRLGLITLEEFLGERTGEDIKRDACAIAQPQSHLRPDWFQD